MDRSIRVRISVVCTDLVVVGRVRLQELTCTGKGRSAVDSDTNAILVFHVTVGASPYLVEDIAALNLLPCHRYGGGSLGRRLEAGRCGKCRLGINGNTVCTVTRAAHILDYRPDLEVVGLIGDTLRGGIGIGGSRSEERICSVKGCAYVYLISGGTSYSLPAEVYGVYGAGLSGDGRRSRQSLGGLNGRVSIRSISLMLNAVHIVVVTVRSYRVVVCSAGHKVRTCTGKSICIVYTDTDPSGHVGIVGAPYFVEISPFNSRPAQGDGTLGRTLSRYRGGLKCGRCLCKIRLGTLDLLAVLDSCTYYLEEVVRAGVEIIDCISKGPLIHSCDKLVVTCARCCTVDIVVLYAGYCLPLKLDGLVGSRCCRNDCCQDIRCKSSRILTYLEDMTRTIGECGVFCLILSGAVNGKGKILIIAYVDAVKVLVVLQIELGKYRAGGNIDGCKLVVLKIKCCKGNTILKADIRQSALVKGYGREYITSVGNECRKVSIGIGDRLNSSTADIQRLKDIGARDGESIKDGTTGYIDLGKKSIVGAIKRLELCLPCTVDRLKFGTEACIYGSDLIVGRKIDDLKVLTVTAIEGCKLGTIRKIQCVDAGLGTLESNKIGATFKIDIPEVCILRTIKSRKARAVCNGKVPQSVSADGKGREVCTAVDDQSLKRRLAGISEGRKAGATGEVDRLKIVTHLIDVTGGHGRTPREIDTPHGRVVVKVNGYQGCPVRNIHGRKRAIVGDYRNDKIISAEIQCLKSGIVVTGKLCDVGATGEIDVTQVVISTAYLLKGGTSVKAQLHKIIVVKRKCCKLTAVCHIDRSEGILLGCSLAAV